MFFCTLALENSFPAEINHLIVHLTETSLDEFIEVVSLQMKEK
jgi:hypothetical protein